ncbi:hypothetical protein EV421DRAFT_1441301 [Armillaria borealis]|uniref:Secreted protein n=1 Tax=Armillaria borealis TaxID=47425 RepID=A0AA39J0I4_9AGAR|nr:hypothetical protein EV421DRAFT_1441301 [Armillaria borealis]
MPLLGFVISPVSVYALGIPCDVCCTSGRSRTMKQRPSLRRLPGALSSVILQLNPLLPSRIQGHALFTRFALAMIQVALSLPSCETPVIQTHSERSRPLLCVTAVCSRFGRSVVFVAPCY